ncbi:hypothetical protein ACVXZY_09575 [Staphylococcus aureus]
MPVSGSFSTYATEFLLIHL